MARKVNRTTRSQNMAAIKSKDTLPELTVRRLIHRLGYRYRLHKRNLPGKPDLVFGPRRKVIFVRGCFWHQHTDCRDGRAPKSNTSYWHAKLRRNVERDAENLLRLTETGWEVLTVWECEIKNVDDLKKRIVEFLSD